MGWSVRSGRFGYSLFKIVLGNTKSIHLSSYLYKGNKTYYQLSELGTHDPQSSVDNMQGILIRILLSGGKSQKAKLSQQ